MSEKLEVRKTARGLLLFCCDGREVSLRGLTAYYERKMGMAEDTCIMTYKEDEMNGDRIWIIYDETVWPEAREIRELLCERQVIALIRAFRPNKERKRSGPR